jgi:hypothetical protein
VKKISFLLLGIVLVGCAHTSYITPEFESITSSESEGLGGRS